MIQQKVEIRFEKGEAIRFISHHDLMRAIMRAVRRAALPVRLTEGFNPRPRIVFPVALEVGVASLDEAAEIELTQCLEPHIIFDRLASSFPPGLVLKAVKEVPPRRAGQIPLRIRYRLHLKEANLEVTPESLKEMLQAPALPFARPREKGTQNVDLRPALLDLNRADDGDLLVDVRPSQKGSARPLEVLSLLTKQPLSQMKKVRVTKLLMELQPAPEMTEQQLKERELLLERERMSLENEPPQDLQPQNSQAQDPVSPP
ncbi:MAG TPA: TIGR03936 family radical SAM-associated protein [Planctomycetota bacterium]|nr:TIGR03936 family radical SAM-associated protein [Planctomycetota bacterium]